jgi:hypothetical protein
MLTGSSDGLGPVKVFKAVAGLLEQPRPSGQDWFAVDGQPSYRTDPSGLGKAENAGWLPLPVPWAGRRRSGIRLQGTGTLLHPAVMNPTLISAPGQLAGRTWKLPLAEGALLHLVDQRKERWQPASAWTPCLRLALPTPRPDAHQWP